MVVDNQLMFHHGIDINYLDSLIPWQRQIHVDLIANYIKEENARQEKLKGRNG